MLRRFLYDDGRLFEADVNGSKLFFDNDDTYQSGMRYKFGIVHINPFSNMWSGKVHPNMSHGVWFNNYFEHSAVFGYYSDNWAWVLESILIGPNWNEDRERYT